MKYKVGDKVRIRGDLEVGKDYRSVPLLERMKCFKNKIAEITKSEDGYYGLSIDNISYAWTDEMLRPAEFKIWCETEEEKHAVLEELEKEGYVWFGSKSKPTKTEITAPVGLLLWKAEYESDSTLSYTKSKEHFASKDRAKYICEIFPSEFTGIDFSEKIIISKTPTGATATYGYKTVTTEGEFDDASRQALAEVLCPFKVGDRVKVTRNNFIGVVKKVDIYNQVTIKCKNCEMTEFIGELEPYAEPLYNAKLFCVKGCGHFEQGRIYEVKDGIIDCFSKKAFKNLEDINETYHSQFMEVKGGLDD